MSTRHANSAGTCPTCRQRYEAGAFVRFEYKRRTGGEHLDCYRARRQKEREQRAQAPQQSAQPAQPRQPSPGDVSVTFDSLAPLADLAKRPHPQSIRKWTELHTMRGSSPACAVGQTMEHWLGVESFETARKFIDSAQWPEGAAMVRKLADSLLEIAPPVSVKRRRVWADHGDSFDIHRAYAGRLDAAWQRAMRQQSRAPRPVRVVIEPNHTWTFKAANLQWAGAAAVALSDLLTEAGYSVEIVMRKRSRMDTPKCEIFEMTAQVKSPLMPLDINALAATVALPAFVRMVVYSAMCHYFPNIGGSLCFPQSMQHEPDDIVAQTAVIGEQAAAEAWIRNAIAKANGRIGEQAAA